MPFSQRSAGLGQVVSASGDQPVYAASNGRCTAAISNKERSRVAFDYRLVRYSGPKIRLPYFKPRNELLAVLYLESCLSHLSIPFIELGLVCGTLFRLPVFNPSRVALAYRGRLYVRSGRNILGVCVAPGMPTLLDALRVPYRVLTGALAWLCHGYKSDNLPSYLSR